MTLNPNPAPKAAPVYLQPRMELWIWLHDLPPLARIRRAIVNTDASTTPAGMAMAIAYESAQGEYKTVTPSGVETSQEGEALTVLLYVRQLAAQLATNRWCLTRSRQWAPSGGTKEEERVGMGCITYTHRLLGHSSGPQGLRSTWWSPPPIGSPPSTFGYTRQPRRSRKRISVRCCGARMLAFPGCGTGTTTI